MKVARLLGLLLAASILIPMAHADGGPATMVFKSAESETQQMRRQGSNVHVDNNEQRNIKSVEHSKRFRTENK